MGVSVVTTRVALRTSTGTQDITVAGFGTPKAALFYSTLCTVDGTARDTAFLSIGMTDGTEEIAHGFYSDHNVATSDTERLASATQVFTTPSGTNRSSFNSWITDGVRIDVDATTGSAYILTVVLFGGTDLSADVHQCAPSTVGTDITSPGFRPDLLIVHGGMASIPYAQNDHLAPTIGFADYNGGTERNRAILFDSYDAQAASTVDATVREDACCGQVLNGSLGWRAAADAFDANGYTMTSNASPGTDEVGVLALNFNSAVSCWVGTMDTPTSTGNDAQTGPAFTPQFVCLLPSLVTSVDAIDSASAGTMGVIHFDDTREYCLTISDEDGQGTTDTQGLDDDQAVNVPADSGSALFTGTFVSLDANGWTINFSATDGSANKWPAMAIGAAAVAGGTHRPLALMGVG